MKKLLLTLLILSLLTPLYAGGNRWSSKPPLGSVVDWSHPLSRGLVACFLMNEGAGKIVNDIARKNNLSFNNSPIWERKQKGYSLNFISASSQSIFTIKNPIVSGNKNFSVEYCIFIPSLPQSGAHVSLGAQADTKGFALGVGGSNINGLGTNVCGLFNNVRNIPTSLSLNIGWNTMCVVFDSNGYPKIYKNGILGYSDTIGAMGSTISTTQFTIGGSVATLYTNNNTSFVRIWNRALSPSEIQQLYQDPYCFIKPPTIWSNFSTTVGATARRFILFN